MARKQAFLILLYSLPLLVAISLGTLRRSAACSAHMDCAILSGSLQQADSCCPTTSGEYLSCCDPVPVPSGFVGYKTTGCYTVGARLAPPNGTQPYKNVFHADECQLKCQQHQDCGVFGFLPNPGECWLGPAGAAHISDSDGIIGPKFCPQVSPVCTGFPSLSLPGTEENDSNWSWAGHKAPSNLQCWPWEHRLDAYRPMLCEKEPITVLSNGSSEVGNCQGLRQKTLNSNDSCARTCERDVECSVWQVLRDGSCWQGFGNHCFKQLGEMPLAGQRLMHGHYRVLGNLTGIEVQGLVGIDVEDLGSLTDPGTAVLRCRQACLSSLYCQVWTYSTSYGCYVEAAMQKRMHLSPTTHPLNLSSGFAKTVIAGQYIQRLCGDPRVSEGSPLGFHGQAECSLNSGCAARDLGRMCCPTKSGALLACCHAGHAVKSSMTTARGEKLLLTNKATLASTTSSMIPRSCSNNIDESRSDCETTPHANSAGNVSNSTSASQATSTSNMPQTSGSTNLSGRFVVNQGGVVYYVDRVHLQKHWVTTAHCDTCAHCDDLLAVKGDVLASLPWGVEFTCGMLGATTSTTTKGSQALGWWIMILLTFLCVLFMCLVLVGRARLKRINHLRFHRDLHLFVDPLPEGINLESSTAQFLPDAVVQYAGMPAAPSGSSVPLGLPQPTSPYASTRVPVVSPHWLAQLGRGSATLAQPRSLGRPQIAAVTTSRPMAVAKFAWQRGHQTREATL